MPIDNFYLFAIDQSCTLGSQYVDINVEGCNNEYPVEVGKRNMKYHSSVILSSFGMCRVVAKNKSIQESVTTKSLMINPFLPFTTNGESTNSLHSCRLIPYCPE